MADDPVAGPGEPGQVPACSCSCTGPDCTAADRPAGPPDMRLDELIKTARALTPEDMDQIVFAAFTSGDDDLQALNGLTVGRNPAACLLLGAVIGLRVDRSPG